MIFFSPSSGQLVLAVLVAGEFVVELLLGELASPQLFGSEALRYGEERHNGVVIQAVGLYLVEYLDGVGQGLGHVAENLVHLLTCLEPLLLGVEHAGGVVKVL